MAEEDFELKKSILQLLARQGANGVTREDFYRKIRALDYETLMEYLERLEGDGLIYLDWTDSARFYAFITEEGIQYLRNTGFLKGEAVRTKMDVSDAKSIDRI